MLAEYSHSCTPPHCMLSPGGRCSGVGKEVAFMASADPKKTDYPVTAHPPAGNSWRTMSHSVSISGSQHKAWHTLGTYKRS